MNTEKWDAIANAFATGGVVPANGWDAWNAQALAEATTIRGALPDSVETIVEVGCGVGRLTPHLALLFRKVCAMDSSPACRVVTRDRCRDRPNVFVVAPDNPYAKGDAAVVWGNLYDDDWTDEVTNEHRAMLREQFPVVLEGNERRWLRWDRDVPHTLTGQFTSFEP